MSAQHTQGRLKVAEAHPSNMFGEQLSVSIRSEGRRSIHIASVGNRRTVKRAQQDARRLVACWNACDGVPTADLEQYASLDGCDNETVARLKFIIGLTRQRDELLAALEKAERKLSAYVGVCTGDKELTDAVLPMARAAIAKVKGGAA